MKEKIKPILIFIRDGSLVFLAPAFCFKGVLSFFADEFGNHTILGSIFSVVIGMLLAGLVFLLGLTHADEEKNIPKENARFYELKSNLDFYKKQSALYKRKYENTIAGQNELIESGELPTIKYLKRNGYNVYPDETESYYDYNDFDFDHLATFSNIYSYAFYNGYQKGKTGKLNKKEENHIKYCEQVCEYNNLDRLYGYLKDVDQITFVNY